MFLGNALRITSFVVLGNHGFAESITRVHIAAGWIFFFRCLSGVSLLDVWLDAQQKECLGGTSNSSLTSRPADLLPVLSTGLAIKKSGSKADSSTPMVDFAAQLVTN
jgi:hypothetical protein